MLVMRQKRNFVKKFRQGKLNDEEVEISLIDNGNNMMHTMDIPGAQLGVFNIGDMFGKSTILKRLKMFA